MGIRNHGLSQGQGSLIALAVAISVGVAAYRLAEGGDAHGEPGWIEWDEADGKDVAIIEPPVVPWRRQRPTQGDLPSNRPGQKRSHRK